MTTFPHFLNAKGRECGEGKSGLSSEELRGRWSPLPCPAGSEGDPSGVSAPLPFLSGLGAEWSEDGGRGAPEYGGRGWAESSRRPPEPSSTRCCPRNLQVLASPQRCPGSPPPSNSGQSPVSPSPKPARRGPAASGVVPPRLPRTSRTCRVRARPRFAFLLRPRGGAARLPCFPPPPSAGLRVSLARLQAGKVPGARPRGAGADARCRRLCGQAPGVRSPCAPRRPRLRVGTLALSGRCGGGRSRAASAAPGGHPAGSGRPARGEPPWEGARGRPRTPGAFRQELRVCGFPVCWARWRGRERRGQCLHLLTKGSPELFFPSGEAVRAGCMHPALPSRHLAALGCSAPGPAPLLAACCGPRGSQPPVQEGVQ